MDSRDGVAALAARSELVDCWDGVAALAARSELVDWWDGVAALAARSELVDWWDGVAALAARICNEMMDMSIHIYHQNSPVSKKKKAYLPREGSKTLFDKEVSHGY